MLLIVINKYSYNMHSNSDSACKKEHFSVSEYDTGTIFGINKTILNLITMFVVAFFLFAFIWGQFIENDKNTRYDTRSTCLPSIEGYNTTISKHKE